MAFQRDRHPDLRFVAAAAAHSPGATTARKNTIMAAGNVPLIDAHALAPLTFKEFNAVRRAVDADVTCRSDDANTKKNNLYSLHEFLTKSSAFDCDNAMREIRARLDSRGHLGEVLRGVQCGA